MKKWLLLLTLLFFSISKGTTSPIENYLSKIEERTQLNPFTRIDSIYAINLDERPGKWTRLVNTFAPYGILPCRLPAVNGWKLPSHAFDEIGFKHLPGMLQNRWVTRFPAEAEGKETWEFLTEKSYHLPIFFPGMKKGAVGCVLSHLSALQDAYDAGYETIWVMEDDLIVLDNPLLIDLYVEKLDELVGKEGWDLLYTDLDLRYQSIYKDEKGSMVDNDFLSDLQGNFWFQWRPDGKIPEEQFRRRKVVSDDFVQVGSRFGTYSMILRRSGIEKILAFEKENGIFNPYDHELFFVPDLHAYCLRHSLFTFTLEISDTQQAI